MAIAPAIQMTVMIVMVLCDNLQVQGGLGPAERLLERLPVPHRHEVVEDGVDGGADVVEHARGVHEPLVDGAEEAGVLEVHVAKALGVERGPAQEEGDHDHGWN